MAHRDAGISGPRFAGAGFGHRAGRQKQWGVHSLLVIRHGYVVANADFYPYNSAAPHDLASVTKTITSTLTGVAVANGLLKLDQTLLSFFPNESPANADDKKRSMTVGNLLHMESGLDCGYLPGEQELEQMKRSANWVQYALSLPMKYDPGTHASYCSPGYHLLGSVIGAAAHMSEADFGRKYLFGPLGMRDVVWGDDPQSRSHGWGDSHFYPRDVAKLGYLYLHGGEWNGKQIVPRDWVNMSITPPAGGRGEPGGFGIEWGASHGANGRQFGGTGRGGQMLMVWPDLDMIVVSMAGGNAGQLTPLIRQAVKSDQPLPANPAANVQLQNSAAAAAKAPAAVSVSRARNGSGHFRQGLSVSRQFVAHRQSGADVREGRHGAGRYAVLRGAVSFSHWPRWRLPSWSPWSVPASRRGDGQMDV